MKRWGRVGVGAVAATAVLALGLQTVGAAEPAGAADRAGAQGCTQTATSVSCSYTGAAAEVVVPAGVYRATVEMAGGSGGDFNIQPNGRGGAGLEMSGRLVVAPGAVVTVGVGGEGGMPDGADRPGDGGWGLDDRSGGRGGMGKHGYLDGAGGGGASVLKVNGVPTVVAPGGGGASHEYDGGSAGFPDGGQGGGSNGGDGGSPGHPANDRAGATPDWVGSGGGGGGSGYYFGEGGGIDKTHAEGGGGGGGGLALPNAFTPTASKPHTGKGFVRITWDTPMTLTTLSGDTSVQIPAGSRVLLRVQLPAGTAGLGRLVITGPAGTQTYSLEMYGPDYYVSIGSSHLPAGTHIISAYYDGNGSTPPGLSNAVVVTVAPADQ